MRSYRRGTLTTIFVPFGDREGKDKAREILDATKGNTTTT